MLASKHDINLNKNMCSRKHGFPFGVRKKHDLARKEYEFDVSIQQNGQTCSKLYSGQLVYLIVSLDFHLQVSIIASSTKQFMFIQSGCNSKMKKQKARVLNTFFSAPVNDMFEIFFDRFSGAFTSSIIPVACSIQLFALHSSINVFNSSINFCCKK